MSYLDSAVLQIHGNYGDLIRMALPDGFDYKTALAVFAVESPGLPFGPSGKPIIRVELHWLFKLWGKNNPELFYKYFQFDKTKNWLGHMYRSNTTGPFVVLHTTGADQQAREYEALDIVARQCGQQATEMAMRGTSMGMGQLMGFHYALLEYSSAGEMLLAASSVSVQIADFMKFVMKDTRLVTAMQTKDWSKFALVYNGSGQVPEYSKRLTDAYAAATRVVK